LAQRKKIEKAEIKPTSKPKKEVKTDNSLNSSTNDEKTPKKGHGAMNGKTGRPFSKENQPSGEAKSRGKQAAKTLRELLSMPVKKGRMAKSYDDFLRECVNVYGIPKELINYRLFMDMRMVSVALKGDVQAYKAVLDRVIGRPREEQAPIVDIPQDDGEKTVFRLPGDIDFEI